MALENVTGLNLVNFFFFFLLSPWPSLLPIICLLNSSPFLKQGKAKAAQELATLLGDNDA